MIEKCQGYKSGQLFFPSIIQAQQHELAELFVGCERMSAPDLASHVVKNLPAFMDILTMTSKSRPRARKLHGATRRKARSDNTLMTDLEQPKPKAA